MVEATVKFNRCSEWEPLPVTNATGLPDPRQASGNCSVNRAEFGESQ